VRAIVLVALPVLVAVQLVVLATTVSSRSWLALDVAAAVASVGLLPVLLRRPVAAAVSLALLAAVSPAATPPATAGVVYVTHRRDLRVAAAVAVASTAAHVARWAWRPAEGLPFGWWVLLVVAAHATLLGWGSFASARRELLSSLRERAQRAETDQARRVDEARAAERARIAHEMHDVLAHRLSLVATHAGALEYRPDASPERVAAAAGVVRAGVHQALEELRDVISVLREPSSPDDGQGGLKPPPTVADLPRLVEESRAVGTRVELDVTGDVTGVPATAGRAAYRVAQEALTNVRRHAPAMPVSVAVGARQGEGLEVEVRNPLPTEAPQVAVGAGAGLVGLAERVGLLGGELSHGRTAGEFRLRAWIPWPDEPGARARR
jgi:signal transduction histidine kinase